MAQGDFVDFRAAEAERLRKIAQQEALEAASLQQKKQMAADILEQQQRAKRMGKPFDANEVSKTSAVSKPIEPTTNSFTTVTDPGSAIGGGAASGIGIGGSIANFAGASNTPANAGQVGQNAGKVSAAPAISGAVTGAGIGAAVSGPAAPVGAVIGAIVGLTAGLLSESAQSKKQKAAAKAKATSDFYESQKKINEDLTKGTTSQFQQLMQSYGQLT